jgi:hypothetical protein
MKAMNRTVLAFVTLALLCVPMALIGQALDFSGWAWMGALVVVMVLASLVDREGFYGASRGRHAPPS